MAQTILVTGGAGYIGSHVVALLLEQGKRVVVLDDLSRGRMDAVKRAEAVGGGFCEFEFGDLGDRAFTQSVFHRWRIDAVVHLAAFKSVEDSVGDPESYQRNNVQATEVLIGAMVDSGVRRVVFSSTATVYGESEGALAEDAGLNPLSPYAQTKLDAEQLLASQAASHGWGVVNLRFFNVAGAHPSGQLGEYVDRPQNLMPVLLAAARLGQPMPIFGTDWATTDGTCVRDYVHVMDISYGVVDALEAAYRVGTVFTWNLGTGRGSTVLEVVEAVRKASGVDVQTEDAARRPGDTGRLVADATLIGTEMGWVPRFDLDAMAGHAWAWMQVSLG